MSLKDYFDLLHYTLAGIGAAVILLLLFGFIEIDWSGALKSSKNPTENDENEDGDFGPNGPQTDC